MVKKTIDYFFKKRDSQTLEDNSTSTEPSTCNVETSIPEHRHSKVPRIELKEVDISTLERDPRVRRQIWEYPLNQQDETRRAYYIRVEPYQYIASDYPLSAGKHPRRFQSSWSKLFPKCLEYSLTKDAAFCLPCYLFNKPSMHVGLGAFTVNGFQSWKKVNDGKKCVFLSHIGKDPNSLHKIVVKCCQDLENQSQHIEKIVEKQTSQQIADNRLQVKASIDAVLTFQACAFRGHDESENSKNIGNFLELLKTLASYNEEVDGVVSRNAPQNASYISNEIQKEILHVFSSKIRKVIREEVGDAKFCIIVDEARDESKREQMAIVLRFVDKEGFIWEHFFDLVHVVDTTALTLEKEILDVLSRHNLNIQNIQGQGYDRASNMHGEWNGLQALISRKYPYAYYIHCFAHRLQLALITASREIIPIHQFFSNLTLIVNVVGSSCKHHDQLRAAQANEIAKQLALNELETGKGLNQIGTIKRAGDTRWGSHLGSLHSLINMFDATCSVLKDIITE